MLGLLQMTLKTILFDLDGTIIDSEMIAVQSILDCYSEWGLVLDKNDAALVAGKKWSVAFDFLFKKYAIPLSQKEASEKILKIYKHKISNDLQTIPGVLDAIRFFSKRFRLGLVSGSNRDDILWALETLKVREHFQIILGAEDYQNSKPAPDGYNKALTLLQELPKHALVFEDSEAGIASAITAKIPVVAITSANHFGHNLQNAQMQMKDFTAVNDLWVEGLLEKIYSKK